MTQNIIAHLPMSVARMLDDLCVPAFLLDVEGPGKFRFAKINRQHELETGVDPSALEGKAPHEVLPERLADTVVANYETCRGRGVGYSYDEMLELASGVKWWHTTLSPLQSDDGRVTQILGLAQDITPRKQREYGQTKRIEALVARIEELRKFAVENAYDSRGPFQTMMGLLALVKEGFVDLGDEKTAQLELCEETARQAIDRTASVLEGLDLVATEEDEGEDIDLGHMCRDLVAVIDPSNRYEIELPEAHIRTSWATLHIVLRSLFASAVLRAQSRISLEVGGCNSGLFRLDMNDDGVLTTGAACDASGQSGDGPDSDLAFACRLIRSCGGDIEWQTVPDRTGAGTRVSVHLPGTLADAPFATLSAVS